MNPLPLHKQIELENFDRSLQDASLAESRQLATELFRDNLVLQEGLKGQIELLQRVEALTTELCKAQDVIESGVVTRLVRVRIYQRPKLRRAKPLPQALVDLQKRWNGLNQQLQLELKLHERLKTFAGDNAARICLEGDCIRRMTIYQTAMHNTLIKADEWAKQKGICLHYETCQDVLQISVREAS